ncbi:hypothetical protein KUW19_00825 [Ferrimonas balearica]|uniref:hypothetical protein n=1 Tax=Ferrimonas balearica TaxID=44012 RepID=UPI001C94B49A|nr:hypothetical protein [Ferrimonas balearica]MBY6105020.1 hypothetical protein [Ferrimonas balearica]
MAYPVDPSAVSIGSDSASAFVPQIWAGKLIEKLYKATVFAEIANTDYEGEIKRHGDKVIIRTVPTLTIHDYVKGKGLTYEDPVSAHVELDIDQGKYFAFRVFKVDEMQSDLALMDQWAEDGAEQMRIAIDGDILGSVYADAAAANAGATAGVISGNINLGTSAAPVSVTKETVLDLLVDYGTILDEQNVPETGRYVVLPAWMCGMIKKSDLKDASLAGDGTSILRNGRLGMIDRFTLYCSNNLSVDTGKTNVIFGHKKALTFAAQITDMENIPNPTDFGRYVRSLNVYGFKVIDPNALGHSVVVKG